MKARDLMTVDVIAVNPDTPVGEIAKLLVTNRISAVPVIDKERRVLGIVTEGDLMRRVEGHTERKSGWLASLFSDPERMAKDYAKSHGRKAGDVMTPHVVSVHEDDGAAEIADLLERHGIKRVTVVREGKLVGIVSRADLLRALTQAAPATAAQLSDNEIYEKVMGELKKQPWASTFYTTVVVRDGVVEYYGYCGSDEYRQAMRVLAESVPGVKGVKDHLVIGPLYIYS